MDAFRAFRVHEADGGVEARFEDIRLDDLAEGDVVIRGHYSSINYKDALAATGAGKIMRRFPLVGGIDVAGEVVISEDARYQAGDLVLVTGCGLGESHDGGFSEVVRVPADWVVPLPAGLTLFEAMALGTAGFTAAMCVEALRQHGLEPDGGDVLVTGASGGVGSIAVAILARLGYRVAAVSGKADADAFLRGLGASEILTREEMSQPPRALEGQRWAGAVDTVGSTMLARVLAETNYGGCVAACGLAGGADLPTTVMPFILRNVSLRGVDSVMCPVERRKAAWQRLVQDLPAAALGEIGQVASLEQLPELADRITRGEIRGRVIVDPNL